MVSIQDLIPLLHSIKKPEKYLLLNFSGSVHNYPAGFFTLINKLNIPYYALSAGENSFYAGLVKSVISGKETMFTYADTYNEIKAVSVLISPSGGNPVTLKEVDYENFIEILMQL